uniref:PAX-interacting protein 1 n=1 Tax=Syphacia muris TaxID=451379 RepID=A0A0N5AX95_9BILA
LQQKQVQLQHHYQPQQQVQIRSLPPIQSQQVITQHRVEQPGNHQQLQEVVASPQQQQQVQSLPGQQPQQVLSERQLQAVTNQQQHLRISYQGQQRVVQGITQPGTQRIRRQSNVQSLELQRQQQQSASLPHLQHSLQPQSQVQTQQQPQQPQQQQQIQLQVQQQQPHSLQRRSVPQFRQQQQLHPLQNNTYSQRFQQPQHLQQNLQSQIFTSNIVAEPLNGVVTRQPNSILVAHHGQIRDLPSGFLYYYFFYWRRCMKY